MFCLQIFCCFSAKYSSELDILLSICTIFYQDVCIFAAMNKKLRIILFMVAAVAAIAMSAHRRNACLYKMSALVRTAAYQAAAAEKGLGNGMQGAPSVGKTTTVEPSICAFVKITYGADSVLQANRCRMLARFGDIYVADIPLKSIAALSLSDKVLRIEAGQSHRLNLDTAAVVVNTGHVWHADRLPRAFTGGGVVVGVMDVGFDATSPNFYDAALSETRIRRFWDQLSPDSVGSTMYVGADYRTADDILRYAHSHDGLIESHGTHTLGIAAGTGYDTPYRGMAYDADICIVSNAVSTDLPLISPEQLYKYTTATDALGFKYIFDYADEVGKPCVASFSEGGTQTFDSEEQLFEEVLASMTGPGRIIVASAGNDGGTLTHQRKPSGVERDGVFFLSESDRSSFSALSDQPFSFCITAYKDGQRQSVCLPTASVVAAADSLLEDSVSFFGHTLKYSIQAVTPYFNSALSAYDIMAEMKGRVGYPVNLSCEAIGSDATVDFFSNGMKFYASSLNPSISGGEAASSIGSPACAPSVICVGATAYRDHSVNVDGVPLYYDCGHDGAVASYSSVGPTRDGRVKPDVVAPGTFVISSASSYYLEADTAGIMRKDLAGSSMFNGRRYPWTSYVGTSMSTPLVAGVIALWLQANPQLTTEQILDIFSATCRRRDAMPQGSKDNHWGYGEIDAYAGMLKVLGIDGIQGLSTSRPHGLSVSLCGDVLRISASESCKDGSIGVSVYSLSGKKLIERAADFCGGGMAQVSLQGVSHGVYAVQLDGNTSATTGSFLIRK